MRNLFFIVIFSAGITLSAQTVSPKAQFEVASVRPSNKNQTDNPETNRVFREIRRSRLRLGVVPMAGPGRIMLQDWPLLDLIAVAYRMRTNQISGPSWLSECGFDIEARVPLNTPPEQLNDMLQSLLADRFGLSVHRSTQMRDGFVLKVSKDGPRLTPAQPGQSTSMLLSDKEQKTQVLQKMADIEDQTRKNFQSGDFGARFSTRSWPAITLDEFANELGRFTEAPVINQTDLTGKYAVTLTISQNSDAPGEGISEALKKLGLRLEPSKVLVEELYVDKVSKDPTPN